ncbi:hypothetical protein Ddye_025551 [Dipteronia dyeriana]|uniref:Disease resistance R13L4/SHOC-2-like LRR domain-containing protein n=1 Tax=Dipteronia dyeriana TaxID=168575 RepID=A0AAD9WNM5_9ROSI|nr:hypothetical protein Ddye_025551 [Dipteronia dyeriana]
MCWKLRSLRVLNVGNTRQRAIPKEIGKLIHLKYLKLKEPDFGLSSLSIFNLQRLQTLDMCSRQEIKLPAEIGKLEELRHLIGNFSVEPLPKNSFQKLRTLKYVSNESWVKIIADHELVNLRELGIRVGYSFSRTEKFSFHSVTILKNLRILHVDKHVNFDQALISFQELSHCQNLLVLRLRGDIDKLPENIHEILPNLECLHLTRFYPQVDPMPLYAKLPNLMFLHLLDCSVPYVKKLRCRANGFHRLEVLQIQKIEELQVEEGALPRLKGLKIPNNCKLTTPDTTRSRILKTMA